MNVVLLFVACVSAALSVVALLSLVCGIVDEKRIVGTRLTLDDVAGDRTLSFVVFAACGAVVSFATVMWLFPVCLAAAFVLSRKMPGLLERRRRRELRSACDGQLDVLADIVAMGVRAGLSFDAALDLYCEKFSCELADQLRAARVRWKSGLASREQALYDLAARLDSKGMRRFAETAVQAVKYGSPLADMLVDFADELRRMRHASIEQQVAKAPVKMFLPLGTCILPALLILVMGPVVLQFLGTGL